MSRLFLSVRLSVANIEYCFWRDDVLCCLEF